ncbi:GlxA family transcriptional regulator [Sphaerotilus sp.]|uniref:GlxA family transcriptional regulator n=1 Tax=Sphaerotilus sp. TaxID=2093942 RepID=UPI002ACEF514|nr:helix-turn-helix domain-containing protein [Sphaerotilus sp.]MDZ7857605.1 helix-turn-helix domain-containing protein [Sphaerotilus sp.]
MIDVLFLVLPDTLLLDIAGPAEAFRLANQALRRRGQPEAFHLRYAGPQAQADSSVGLRLAALEPLPVAFTRPTWVVLLGRPGEACEVIGHGAAWMDTRRWLAQCVAPRLVATSSEAGGLRLLTVCSGALLAADAGLLAGRQVTTHHELLDDLQALAPTARVQANRVFVEDGAVLTSAGVTAGIDLALHGIAQVCGEVIAAAVAQVMVVFARRGGQAPQASALLAHRDHLHPAVHRVQDAVCAAPAEPWDSPRMAAVAHVTERHLARLFRLHTGLSPRAYVERVRSALAGQALAQGHSAPQAAALAGFSGARQMRQALER